MWFINYIDLGTIDFIKNNLDNKFFDTIMPVFTNLGNGGLVWIIISIFLLTQKKYRKIGVVTLVALLVTYLVGEIGIKNLVRRERPFMSIHEIKLLIKAPSGFSFPSGHTASSFTASTILSSYFKKYRAIIFSLAIIIGFSRIYLMVHYLSDVLGGAVLGIGMAILIKYIFKKFEKNYLL
ncbi:phosphatase PAP2 family protein [Clostridium sp. YIM B02551]|uniref:phosphatase PAP2 family protein n=1 Tax=Clostridium sp. YIM B02551 TaxID=2910679 RepID=UPI001EEBFB1D|nr:phosphatase PAP2 family protein [Clostridium sp. YIM B02551]